MYSASREQARQAWGLNSGEYCPHHSFCRPSFPLRAAAWELRGESGRRELCQSVPATNFPSHRRVDTASLVPRAAGALVSHMQPADSWRLLVDSLVYVKDWVAERVAGDAGF